VPKHENPLGNDMFLPAPARVPITPKVAPSKSIEPSAANIKVPLGATVTVSNKTFPLK